MLRPLALTLLLALAGIGEPAAGNHPLSGSRLPAPGSRPEADETIRHALNRLTYGPRPGDVDRVKAMGLQKWIETQLHPSRIDNNSAEARLAPLSTLTLDAQTIQRDYAGPAMVERRQRKLAAGTSRNEELAAGNREMASGSPLPAPGSPLPAPGSRLPAPGSRQTSDVLRKGRQVITDLEQAKLLRAVYSERQLEEVLVDFWFNHFNVFAGKGATRNYVGEYEREAIRPYVLGNFRDMLGATARHPAMLFYLDNWLSSAGDAGEAGEAGEAREARATRMTRARVRRPQPNQPRRSSGLNENYARELLELHTLGVDGGYSQQDIVNVARAFTGWSMQPRQGSGFMFLAARHDRGEKVVLGHTLKAGGGIDDGERVLDIVAAHPSTARHIATQLAIRFVSDTPPPALVDRMAAKFTATKGDLREVICVLVASPEFLSPDAYRVKVKTPFEFVASALRATGAEIRTAVPLARTLQEMGMPLYFCQPPTGYDDTATPWVNAGALVSRMNFAVDLSKNAVRGVRVPLSEAETLALKIGAPEFQRQ